ncbi:MAG: spore coat protein U domain-containing protein [Proteobacteria bacterium]|nr:spore coat protein U domain-containing protein [Pseudomonadota bacterium]
MNHTLLRCCAALLLIGFGLFWHKPAQATISCSSTAMSALAFGNVDPQSSQTDSTANFTYTCSNNDKKNTYSATICFSIGEPGGGPTNPRQMKDGSGDLLNFQMYQDPARSVVWGSQFFGFLTPLVVNVTLTGTSSGGSTINGAATLYGRVLANQTTAIPGSYSDVYGSVDSAVTINQQTGGTAPGSCSATQTGSTFPFTVSATVLKKCTVTASTLNFGNSVGLLTSAVNATTTLGVQCSNGTPYNVGLDAGSNGGGNINARKMVLGANSIAYQLYQNSARTTVWGNTVGTNTVAGTGNGNSQSLTVYGGVPAQVTPPAGTYNDTITVTVTY